MGSNSTAMTVIQLLRPLLHHCGHDGAVDFFSEALHRVGDHSRKRQKLREACIAAGFMVAYNEVDAPKAQDGGKNPAGGAVKPSKTPPFAPASHATREEILSGLRKASPAMTQAAKPDSALTRLSHPEAATGLVGTQTLSAALGEEPMGVLPTGQLDIVVHVLAKFAGNIVVIKKTSAAVSREWSGGAAVSVLNTTQSAPATHAVLDRNIRALHRGTTAVLHVVNRLRDQAVAEGRISLSDAPEGDARDLIRVALEVYARSEGSSINMSMIPAKDAQASLAQLQLCLFNTNAAAASLLQLSSTVSIPLKERTVRIIFTVNVATSAGFWIDTRHLRRADLVELFAELSDQAAAALFGPDHGQWTQILSLSGHHDAARDQPRRKSRGGRGRGQGRGRGRGRGHRGRGGGRGRGRGGYGRLGHDDESGTNRQAQGQAGEKRQLEDREGSPTAKKPTSS